ncbi:MAG TPA: elongation factor P [Victivallales bacterium]|nr:elongation factor P [Victivallales bacterium]
MITANRVKSGSVIEVNGTPHIVQSVAKHTPTARGGSTLFKIRAKNLIKDGKIDLTCNGDDHFQEPDFQKREVQYLYAAGDTHAFMDIENYEQYELSTENISEQLKFLKEEMEGIIALLLEGHIVAIKPPSTVVQKLVECDPAIKGASATARTKPAITETGLEIQVPEYMKNEELVKIDTETGKFISRA